MKLWFCANSVILSHNWHVLKSSEKCTEEKHLKTKKILFIVIKLPSCKLEEDGYSFNSVAEPLSLAWGAPVFPQGLAGEPLIEGLNSNFHDPVFNTLCTLSPTLFLCLAIRLCTANDLRAPNTHHSQQFRVLCLYSGCFFCLKCSSWPCWPGKLQGQMSFLWCCFPTSYAASTSAAFVFSLNWCYGL